MEKIRADNSQYLIRDFDIDTCTLSVTELKPLMATNGHEHAHQEAYYIISGNGLLNIEGKETVITGGLFFYIAPNQYHKVTNMSPENDLKFICAWGKV